MIAYHREGSGEPLLLTHGIGERWHYWLPVLPALAKTFDCVAIDLPGFGASPELPKPWGLDDLRVAVERLLDDLGWDRPHVSGISMGGWVALQLGIHGRAASVTALSPAGLLRPGLPTRMAGMTLDSIRRTTRLISPVVETVGRSAAARVALQKVNLERGSLVPPDVFAGDIRAAAFCPGWDTARSALNHCDITGADALAELPVTVAFGSKDKILRPGGVDRSRLPASVNWLSLAGCGHTPTYDDPALVVETIRSTAARASVPA